MPAAISELATLLRPGDVDERCGFVMADGSVIEVENIHPQPHRGFLMSAAAVLQAEEAVAIWHTHPTESSALSHEDYRGFLQWPDMTHIIIGTDQVRVYQVVDGFVREATLQ